MKNIPVIILLMVLFIPGVAFAQQGSVSRQLIFDFKAAVKIHDKQKILTAYRRLKESPEALEALKKDQEYFQLYKAYGLVEKMETQQATSKVDDKVSTAAATAAKAIKSKTTNKDIVQNNPNQERAPNSKLGKAYPNQKRMQDSKTSNSNSAQVRKNPNQDQVSNSRRVRQQSR